MEAAGANVRYPPIADIRTDRFLALIDPAHGQTVARCHRAAVRKGRSATTECLPGGGVHNLAEDLAKALRGGDKARLTWHDITSLARDEWIFWVASDRKAQARAKWVRWRLDNQRAGKRRPCSRPGCPHRG
nr:YdeI/OmpD-associated family protein [uncultured Sphingomonas sp.]